MTTSASVLDERIEQSLKYLLEEMLEKGELLSQEKLRECYALFRSRFAPDRLLSIDGEELLNTMHAHGNRESLVYWLEFKDDEEFPAAFGSIAGGSALKFGIYRRKDTGSWMTGSSQSQTEITTAEAIVISRKHREQLVSGAKLLEALPANGTDEDYLGLQKQMDELAPDVSRMAWGHKYFSLLYPDKLDDYHVESFQRFHLIKLLQTPPEASGRYVAAGRYVAIARDLAQPLNRITTVLNRLNGRPYRVWRIGTRLGAKESIWEQMRDGAFVAIGWGKLGDLSGLQYSRESKDRIRESLQREYELDANVASRKAGEILNFAKVIADGELVLAADGKRLLGIGRVTGDYKYKTTPHAGAPHHRPVEWLSLKEWELPVTEGLLTTVYHIRKNVKNLIAIERHLLDSLETPGVSSGIKVAEPLERLDGIPGRVQAILNRKGQVILYGPPGTGKTYWARRAALDLAALGSFGRRYSDLEPTEKSMVTGDDSQTGLLRVCTFHPAYGYEDFLEGYRPRESGAGQLVFERRDGIFKRLCADAARQPERKFYLLIDEINRGDIPRIFGELLTVLERDKRGQAMHLPLSGERFSVPENVYVIGTMNTADRSIALLDTALRRRFGFFELMPDPAVLGDSVVGGSIPLGPWLSSLNERIRANIGRDARNLQIGHAYLLDGEHPVSDFSIFSRILEEDILPLLEEYCYEDYASLAQVLGRGLVDEGRQRFRGELFAPARRDELNQALLAPCPDIATSPQAIALPETEEEPEDTSDEDEVVG